MIAKGGGWLILAAVLLLFPSAARAQVEDLERTVGELQATYEKIQDLSAQFHQLSTQPASGFREESRGSLMMKRPGKMRWEYRSPDRRLIVSDGRWLYLYFPAERQVVIQEAPVAFAPLGLNFLTGMGKLAEDFRIQWGRPEKKAHKGNLLLELKPVDPSAQIQEILMEIHPQTFLVERMILRDTLSSTTILTFKRVRINSGLDDRLFSFVPPPGTRVIEGLPGTRRPEGSPEKGG